jgi:hypothetical protein
LKIPDKSTVKQNFHLLAALAAWTAAVLIISILVYRSPLERTVTPVYHEAVDTWLAGKQLYSEYAFHYPPQFIFIFMPFHFMPLPLGDILWRIVSAVLLVWGLWRITDLARLQQNGFLNATWIALLPSLGAISNGQANVIFGAFTTLAAASLTLSRWWLASLFLIGALAVKGAIGLVMISLAALRYRALIWRLVPGLAIFLAFPFLFFGPAYVLSQYQQYAEHLLALSVNERHFANLNELLLRLGTGLTSRTFPLLGIAAGLATTIAWWVGARRKPEPERAWLLLGLTTTYLMLFNPMNEVNSFVIVAPILALCAVQAMQSREHAKLGYGMAFMGFSIGLFPEIFRGFDKDFGMWWDPLMMLPFGAILIYSIFSEKFTRRTQEMTGLGTKT